MSIKKVSVRAKRNLAAWSKTEPRIQVFCNSLTMHFTENLQEYFFVRNQFLFKNILSNFENIKMQTCNLASKIEKIGKNQLKKHDANFEIPTSDLKSARKTV